MHFGDYTFIFLLALVLFGPRKLPEIGKQLGKLLSEFRRASNEFKFQIQEELRNMEDEERRKKLAEQQAALTATTLAAGPGSETSPAATATPTILPPSTGTQVSTERPYANPVEVPEGTPVSSEVAGIPAPAMVPTAADEPPAPPQVQSPPAEPAAAALPESGSEPVSLAGVQSGTPESHHG